MTAGAVVALLMLAVFAMGWQIMGWMIFAGGVYCGMKRFCREAGGSVGYFRALFAGVQTAFFASLILAFVGYVTARMEPSVIDATLDAMERQLKESGAPSGLADAVMQQWREILSPVVLAVITVVMCSAAGSVTAAACAFFVGNGRPRVAR
jgi:hypothetical protein